MTNKSSEISADLTIQELMQRIPDMSSLSSENLSSFLNALDQWALANPDPIKLLISLDAHEKKELVQNLTGSKRLTLGNLYNVLRSISVNLFEKDALQSGLASSYLTSLKHFFDAFMAENENVSSTQDNSPLTGKQRILIVTGFLESCIYKLWHDKKAKNVEEISSRFAYRKNKINELDINTPIEDLKNQMTQILGTNNLLVKQGIFSKLRTVKKQLGNQTNLTLEEKNLFKEELEQIQKMKEILSFEVTDFKYFKEGEGAHETLTVDLRIKPLVNNPHGSKETTEKIIQNLKTHQALEYEIKPSKLPGSKSYHLILTTNIQKELTQNNNNANL